jgi:hypothetical protein
MASNDELSTTAKSGEAHEALCAVAHELGGTVRLTRETNGWGLVTTVPANASCQHRAAGFLFDDLSELDTHAQLALSWLASAREADPTASERRQT